MTNTELLEEKILKSGLKKSYLADKVGLSKAGFRNCCVNKADFKSQQIKTLCDELKIDNAEMITIFFDSGGA